MIVATAGHVDHGKTALIKALSGADTDRLPEEKARGLSIDLGFAYQSLTGNATLGYVDVPGHERFIRNMLAGVAGIDLGLLVVAADDGVMPQTREHLAILDLLGIRQYVIAITKIDRVDDGRILAVQSQVEKLLDKIGQPNTTIYPVCAPDNAGITALRNDLDRRARDVCARPIDGHFRMAIDRAFTLKGIGLVVTGMVFSGEAAIDDKLVLSSNGSQVRIRGIRVHNEISDRARTGLRCALNISGRGVNEDTVSRGNWLLHSDLYVPTRRIDVELRVLDSEARPLKHWTPTHLHIGADHLAARVAVLSGGAIAAGGRGLAQLVLEQDAFVVHGDRFVLRDQSAQRTIAGGHVIDPFSPKRGRARPTRIAALEAMNREHSDNALGALCEISETGVPIAPFSISHNFAKQKMDAVIESLSLRRVGQQPQERVFDNQQWRGLLDRVEQTVGVFHEAKPKLSGPGLREVQLRVKPYIETGILEEVVASLLEKNRLGQLGSRFHLPSHVVEISDFDQQLLARAAIILAPETGSPLSLHQAAEALDVDKKKLEATLKHAMMTSEMILLAKNRYLPSRYLVRLCCAAEELAQGSAAGMFTVADYCRHTKIGRNFAIELLEYFDRRGLTKRIDNNRTIRQSAAMVFPTDGQGIK